MELHYVSFFFFFNDTATTEIYTLSLHDALPILSASPPRLPRSPQAFSSSWASLCLRFARDRKSTRLNSSHGYISYAVFCLKKKTRRDAKISANQEQTMSSCLSPNYIPSFFASAA